MVNLHYLNRYNKMISYYKENISNGYMEKHHIVPKCMGGIDTLENIILLPARVHFICHYLLHKSYPDNGPLALAFAMMAVKNQYQDRKITSRFYENAKIIRSKNLKGKPRPEYVKEKLRKPKNNRENYKKPKSETHKENISKSLLGKKHNWHHKVISSQGYINSQNRRKEQAMSRKKFHIDNFKSMNIEKHEYCKLFPNITRGTIYKYLRGL